MRLQEPFVYHMTEIGRIPSVFDFLMKSGPIALAEAYATFNMGAVSPPTSTQTMRSVVYNSLTTPATTPGSREKSSNKPTARPFEDHAAGHHLRSRLLKAARLSEAWRYLPARIISSPFISPS